MADSQATDQKPDTTTNRWWVDSSGASRAKAQPAAEGVAGSRFFKAGDGFEQEPARDRLTDNNLKVLKQAGPVAGQWSYVKLGDSTFAARQLERIKQEVALPAYACGVVVDCGRTVRLLVTGTQPGERLLELTLGEAPSFDCWVHDEWVHEEVFKNSNAAIREFKRLMRDYLSPEAIALAQEVAARA